MRRESRQVSWGFCPLASCGGGPEPRTDDGGDTMRWYDGGLATWHLLDANDALAGETSFAYGSSQSNVLVGNWDGL